MPCDIGWSLCAAVDVFEHGTKRELQACSKRFRLFALTRYLRRLIHLCDSPQSHSMKSSTE